ncbi:MAG: helix-turn-helix domain-containing protein [Prolixibacteraceae bacterium]|jgi:DNA-binding XRE family transcriptional regulator|nr:helix-turn-helix domain-containing protein [Prolixibacteraceae bacterium]
MEMKKIKEARIKKGISQTAMANEIGLSQPGYANIENGETKNIPLLVAVKISKVLGIGFNELYDIDGDSQKIDGLNKEIKALHKRVIELEDNVRDKKLIIDLIFSDDFISVLVPDYDSTKSRDQNIINKIMKIQKSWEDFENENVKK